MSSKKVMLALSGIGLFLLATGISLLVFSLVKKGSGNQSNPSASVSQSRSKVNLDAPKVAECPINGGKFTQAEKDIWSKRRPIVAMIENSTDARPQSGLSKADVIYEAVAEGGITRFMGVFYCGVAAEDVKIAPVRSARIYFVNYAQEYGNKPIYMHVGGANDYSGSGDTAKNVRALETLEQIGWRVPKGNDFDTTFDAGYPIFWRNYERLNHEVATEHTMMADLDAAYTEADKRGLNATDSKGLAWDKNFTQWKFADGKPASSPTATDISFEFWSGKPDYNAEWKYDSSNNQYLRFTGGQPHLDLDTNTQLSAKNVVIIFAKETGPVDKNLHLFYTTIGTGQALVFQNGTVIQGTWSKDSAMGRTKVMDDKGKEISFVRGVTWMEVVPAGNKVNY